MAIYQGVFLFAVGIGPFPGGLLAAHLGLAAPFIAYPVASLAAGAVAWFGVAETRDLDETKPLEECGSAHVDPLARMPIPSRAPGRVQGAPNSPFLTAFLCPDLVDDLPPI